MKKILLVFIVAVAICSCGANDKEKNEIREFFVTTFKQVNKSIQGVAIDDITVCDSCVFRNDRIYYYYTIDEEYLPISQFEAEKSARREMVKEVLDTNMSSFIEKLKKLDDGGFTYVYRGNTTGDIVSFDIDY